MKYECVFLLFIYSLQFDFAHICISQQSLLYVCVCASIAATANANYIYNIDMCVYGIRSSNSGTTVTRKNAYS